jgi:hypothetical protein
MNPRRASGRDMHIIAMYVKYAGLLLFILCCRRRFERWCRLSTAFNRAHTCRAGAGQFAADALSGLSVIVYARFQSVSHRSNVSLFVQVVVDITQNITRLYLDNDTLARGFSMRVRRYRPCPLDMCLKFDIFLGRIYLLLLIECLREMDALETRSAAALRSSRRLLYSTDNSL